MKKLMLVMLVLLFSTSVFGQSFVVQNNASLYNSGTSQSTSRLGRDSLNAAYAVTTMFGATGSGVVPPNNTAYHNIRIKFSANNKHVYAYLQYVSPYQINFLTPKVYEQGGDVIGNVLITIEKGQGGGWVVDRSATYYIYDVAPQHFINVQDLNGIRVDWCNAVVYATTDGVNYFYLRNTQNNPGGEPSPVPRTYAGYPVIIAFYLTGAWANINSVNIKLDGENSNSNITGRANVTEYVGLQQINWKVPASMNAGVRSFDFSTSTFSLANVGYISWQ